MLNSTYCEILTNRLVQILLLLKQLDDSNFSEQTEEITNILQEINKINDSYSGELNMEELMKNNSIIDDLAKQIQSFIDNIISSKQSESATILSELKKMQNFKKIATYER